MERGLLAARMSARYDARLQSDAPTCRSGETGRRAGLKIPFGQPSVGSTPTSGTKLLNDLQRPHSPAFARSTRAPVNRFEQAVPGPTPRLLSSRPPSTRTSHPRSARSRVADAPATSPQRPAAVGGREAERSSAPMEDLFGHDDLLPSRTCAPARVSSSLRDPEKLKSGGRPGSPHALHS